MKKIFIVLFAATMALAFAACTEKENITPGSDGTETPDTPPTPQHNELYETTWIGSGQYSTTLPIIGNFSMTIDNTLNFLTDSTATSYLKLTAFSMSFDTTLNCAYIWNAPQGTLLSLDNADLSINFTKTNETTINITVNKSDIAAMWPSFETVSAYLPEDGFSIDLYKQ